jgi:hypothetical protein
MFWRSVCSRPAVLCFAQHSGRSLWLVIHCAVDYSIARRFYRACDVQSPGRKPPGQTLIEFANRSAKIDPLRRWPHRKVKGNGHQIGRTANLFQLHPTHPKRCRIIQNEMPRILLNSKTMRRNSCEWSSEDPSAHDRRVFAQNLRSQKIQVIGIKRFGSLGKIRTSNPSVNSRMLYH